MKDIKIKNRKRQPTDKTNTKTQKNIINWTAYQLESTQNIQMQHISKQERDVSHNLSNNRCNL